VAAVEVNDREAVLAGPGGLEHERSVAGYLGSCPISTRLGHARMLLAGWLGV
jgi:hypothetical protein